MSLYKSEAIFRDGENEDEIIRRELMNAKVHEFVDEVVTAISKKRTSNRMIMSIIDKYINDLKDSTELSLMKESLLKMKADLKKDELELVNSLSCYDRIRQSLRGLLGTLVRFNDVENEILDIKLKILNIDLILLNLPEIVETNSA